MLKRVVLVPGGQFWCQGAGPAAPPKSMLLGLGEEDDLWLGRLGAEEGLAGQVG